MSAKYKSPSFLLPNELNTDTNPSLSADRASMYSMDFDGSSHINCGNDSSLNFERTDSFSISAWVKRVGNGTTQFIFSKATNSSPYPGYSIYINPSNKIASNINISYPSNHLSVNGNTTLNTSWNHVCVTYDGSSNASGIKLYLNGVAETTSSTGQTSITGTLSNSHPVNIGARNSSDLFFNGSIDEVAVFNRALNTTEIAALYNGTGSNIYPSNLMATDLNPIAYYPLGEQAQNSGYLSATGNEWQFPNGVLQDYVMDFDGSSSFNSSSALFSGANKFTISLWVNLDTNNNNNVAYSLYNDNSNRMFLQFWNGQLYIRINSGSSAGTYIIGSGVGNWSSTIVLNQWGNITVVYDGTQSVSNDRLKVWVNGDPNTSGSYSGTFPTSLANWTDDFYIGAYDDASSQSLFLDGKLSNLAIWNTDQSTNIDNIYNNGSPQTTYTVAPQNWWKLNADSVYTPSAPNYTTSLNLPQPLSASNYIDFPTGGSGWSFNDGAGNDTPFTVSAWVYNTSSTSKYRLLSKNTVGNGGGGYEYSMSAGGRNLLGDIEIYLYDSTSGGGSPYIGAKATLHKPNEWVHVAFTYDASAAATGLKIYANGEQLTDTDVTVGSYTSMGIKTSKPNIGRTVGSAGCEGNVSNLTVFNSELTASQISTLFNFGTPETTPSFSPTLWFKLDNTTTGIQSAGSLTGASYNGTIGGSVTATSPASVAVVPSWKIPTALTIPSINYTSALKLESSNSESVAFSSSINTSSTTTFSMWLKPTSTNNQYLLPTGSGVNGILIRNSKIYFYDFNAGSGFPQSSDISSTLADGNWHHLAITRDNRSVNFYLDGNTMNHGSPLFTADFTSFNISDFGKTYATSQGAYYDGEVSNLAIFNSVLSLANIQTLYNNGQPQDSISFTPTNWFKLNSINGTTVTDTNGSNNGTTSGSIETTDVKTSDLNIPVNGVSTTLPSTALQQSDLQFDSPYSNYSLSFDGTGDYITISSIPSLEGATEMSISCWVKRNSTGHDRIFGWWGSASPYADQRRFGFAFDSSNELLFQTSPDGATMNFARSTATITDTAWHHVAVTYKANSPNGIVKFYIDGQQSATTGDASATIYNLSTDYMIAFLAPNDSSGREFYGNIDELSVFTNELTSAQILEIYNNGKPGNLSNYSGTAPISWWRLGENAYFNTGTTPGPEFTVPNSISGAPNGTGSGTINTMISADAPGTYANGIGTNLDIIDRVGDAALSASNSQSYNMIPSDISPYVPQYVGDQIANNFSMAFDGLNDYFNIGTNIDVTGDKTFSFWIKRDTNAPADDGGILSIAPTGATSDFIDLAIWQDQIQGVTANGGGSNKRVATTISKNVWVHITVIKNSSAITNIYINGVNQTLTSGGNWSYSAINTPRHQIGTSAGYYYTGLIDEVAIFDTALNAGQIYNDIYQPTATGTNQTADIANNPNLPNPVAWYRMGD